jgi:hypothetical protein
MWWRKFEKIQKQVGVIISEWSTERKIEGKTIAIKKA